MYRRLAAAVLICLAFGRAPLEAQATDAAATGLPLIASGTKVPLKVGQVIESKPKEAGFWEKLGDMGK